MLKFSLGENMYSVDIHPARRKGELNFSDPGRDWGPASHIVPGRRVNEPNHKAWHSPVALLARSRAGFELFSEEDEKPADKSGPSDAYEEMALAMVKTIGDSVNVLKSIAEIMPVLERMLVARDGEGVHEEGRREVQPRSSESKSKPGDSALCWSSDMMVEIHNLCAQNRQSGASHPKAVNGYGSDPEPDNDILPPLRYFHDQ